MNTDWGGAAKGAAGGAMTGAAMGSVVGPWGTAIGGVAGGLIGGVSGLFGSDDHADVKAKLQAYYDQLNGPQKPAEQSAYSGFRNNQADLINRLEAMSKGQGPSLAAQQFQQATDRNVAGQQAMANSGRGGPMAQLTAANNMAGLGAQAAQGSAIARTNEQMGAFSQLGGAINQGRQSDEQTNLANMQARMQALGMNAQQRMQLLNMMQGNAMPATGDQWLAGGAGAFSTAFGQGQFGKNSPGAQPGYAPQSPSPTSPTNSYGGDSTGMFGKYQRPPYYGPGTPK